MTVFSKTINRMQRDKERGFTLIELMIVVAILGILAAIAIPNFMRFQAKSRQSEAKTNLGAIGVTAESFRAESTTGYVVAAIGDLGWSPQGTTRYSYWYDVGGTATIFTYPAASYSGGVIDLTAVTGCNRSTAPTVTAVATTATTFTAGAKGEIDNDVICDEWSYTEARALNNDNNDVSL